MVFSIKKLNFAIDDAERFYILLHNLIPREFIKLFKAHINSHKSIIPFVHDLFLDIQYVYNDIWKYRCSLFKDLKDFKRKRSELDTDTASSQNNNNSCFNTSSNIGYINPYMDARIRYNQGRVDY